MIMFIVKTVIIHLSEKRRKIISHKNENRFEQNGLSKKGSPFIY